VLPRFSVDHPISDLDAQLQTMLAGGAQNAALLCLSRFRLCYNDLPTRRENSLTSERHRKK
jgi:hypothetical protein